MQQTGTPIFSNSLDSAEANKSNEKALESYQQGLKEHVIMQRALDEGLVDSSLEISRLYDSHRSACYLRGVDHNTPQEVARFILSIMASPSQLFPQLAEAVEKEVQAIDVSHLVRLFHPEHNKKLKNIDGESKGILKLMGTSPAIVKTLQCELLHEREFNQGGTVNSISYRLKKWVNSGTGNSLSLVRRGIVTAVGIALGPAGLLGLGVNNMAGYFVSLKDKALSKTLNRLVDRLDKSTIGKEGYFKGLVNKFNNHSSRKVLLLLSAYAFCSASLGFYALNLHVEHARFPLEEVNELIKTFKLDVGLPNYSSTTNLIAGGFFGAIASRLIDKFSFSSAISPLKNDPFQVQEPVLHLVGDPVAKSDAYIEGEPSIGIETLAQEVFCEGPSAIVEPLAVRPQPISSDHEEQEAGEQAQESHWKQESRAYDPPLR